MFKTFTFNRAVSNLIFLSMLLMAGAARAAGGEDELGDGICRVVNLLTGKFLFGIAVLAMVAGGGALLFGAELTDGVKKVVTIVAIVGMIVSFGGILSFAFNAMASNGC